MQEIVGKYKATIFPFTVYCVAEKHEMLKVVVVIFDYLILGSHLSIAGVLSDYLPSDLE